jgi:hypothetical protein
LASICQNLAYEPIKNVKMPSIPAGNNSICRIASASIMPQSPRSRRHIGSAEDHSHQGSRLQKYAFLQLVSEVAGTWCPLTHGGFEIGDSQQHNQYHIGQKLNASFTMLKRQAPDGFVGSTLQKLRALRRHKDHRYFQIFWRAKLFPYLRLKGPYRQVIPILCKT